MRTPTDLSDAFTEPDEVFALLIDSWNLRLDSAFSICGEDRGFEPEWV